jgi:hypothetical protein
MNREADSPLSPVDAEIEMLLRRLASIQSAPPDPHREAIQAVMVKAIRDRLRLLSRKCTDRTCRIRIIEEARNAAGEEG